MPGCREAVEMRQSEEFGSTEYVGHLVVVICGGGNEGEKASFHGALKHPCSGLTIARISEPYLSHPCSDCLSTEEIIVTFSCQGSLDPTRMYCSMKLDLTIHDQNITNRKTIKDGKWMMVIFSFKVALTIMYYSMKIDLNIHDQNTTKWKTIKDSNLCDFASQCKLRTPMLHYQFI